MGRSGEPGRFGWPAALGLLVSVLLVWWTLHDVRLADVWEHVRGVKWIPLSAAIAAATFTFPLRTVRWQALLRLEGERIAFIPLWHATAIGFMSTNILPARTGELARAYAARRLTGVTFTSAVGSIAVERVFDGLTLVAFLAVAMWAGRFTGETEIGTVSLGNVRMIAATGFSVALVIAAVFVKWPHMALNATRHATKAIMPEKWSLALVSMLKGVLAGLESLKSPQRFLTVAGWSIVVWLTGATSFLLGFRAFGIEVPWSAALMLQSLLAFGIAVQFSPGFFGQFEALCRLTLALYSIGASASVSFAFGFHLGGFLPITLLGLWSLSRAHLHLADLKSNEDGSG